MEIEVFCGCYVFEAVVVVVWIIAEVFCGLWCGWWTFGLMFVVCYGHVEGILGCS